VRPTDDVDLVVEVASYVKYQDLLAALRKLGFIHDMDGPLCRMQIQGIKVDVMPTREAILSFNNRWYPLAVANAANFKLSNDVTIKLISAPLFLCTKLDAFSDRGHGDYLSSSDIEDIVAIVNGRDELVEECAAQGGEVVEYLAANFRHLLDDDPFLNALPGILPFAARNREAIVKSRMEELGVLV
jgi:predicted nucleotidyltransferase